VSSKKRYHDVVGVSRGAKMGAREVKEPDIDKAARGLFPKKGRKLRKFG